MKRHKVKFNDFGSVFTNRRFDLRYRITKRIYLVDDELGSLSIEEHPSLIGYAFFFLVLTVAIPVNLVIGGISSIPPIGREFKLVFIDREPLRKDDVKYDQESTKKLLSVMGLKGLNNG